MKYDTDITINDNFRAFGYASTRTRFGHNDRMASEVFLKPRSEYNAILLMSEVCGFGHPFRFTTLAVLFAVTMVDLHRR